MVIPAKRETFAPVDAAWLHMDRPVNPMMITGIMMFDDPLDLGRVKQVVEERLLTHRRFRQRIRKPLLPFGLPRWEDDPYFNLDVHIQRLALPEPGDVCALQELAGHLMSSPVDYNRPLWHFYLIENFQGGGALVCRLHHCIADGLALMRVLLSMTDAESLPQPMREGKKDTRLLRERMRTNGSSGNGVPHGAAELLVHEGMETLLHPSHALDLARLGKANALAAGKLVLTLPDRRTVLKGTASGAKRAAWTQRISLQDVKEIAHLRDATVNDVLLAAVAGGLRRYLEGRGQPTEGMDVRAMVPVSIRREHEIGKLGNRFGLVILTLPVSIRDTNDRLLALKQRMDKIKGTPEPMVAFGILAGMGLSPVEIEKIIVDIFASKVTGVMTNVPGPNEPRYLAGSRLSGLMFWVPTGGNIGLGISILSYAGGVMVGVATDTNMVADPQAIVTGIQDEMAEMQGWVGPQWDASCGEQPDAEQKMHGGEPLPVAVASVDS
jgi:diacylglycerol O-acyltransferase / wax synthase